MSQLISYSQNNEDIVLNRALRHIDNGFYIDVGAFDPSHDSVTKLFYDRGWSGINIEPLSLMYERLVAERSRDHNLNVALSDRAGEMTFYSVGQTGLSTLDAKAAEKARSEGLAVEETRTKVNTLAEVCRTVPIRDIHFLKIDVEGAEQQVLLGADFETFRPWIVVVEATTPGTSERVDDQWRSLLEEAGYETVLFDGLNVFFLSAEHHELRSSLLAPANVLDAFIPIQHHAALLRLGSLLPEVEEADGSLADGSLQSLRNLVAWHEAFARENQEREASERIAWNRADAEAAVRRSMEDTIAWNRADAKAAERRSMEDTILWNRADAEAHLRRTMEDTIAWHRADAAERAYQSGCSHSDDRLRERIVQEVRAKQAAQDEAAALRRLRLEQAAGYAAAEAEFHDVRSKHDRDVAHLQKAHEDLLAWREAVRTSTSWRLTRPLRVLMRRLRQLWGASATVKP